MEPTSQQKVHLVLLGVAQDAGVPQTGCTCENCSAVWSGKMPRQYAVSAAVVDPSSSSYWLIDCTPDFRDQYHLLQSWLGEQGRGEWWCWW
jgi:pyrroloquinoline quinone biosynthesis protein B